MLGHHLSRRAPRTSAQRIPGLTRLIGAVDMFLVGPSRTQAHVEVPWTGKDVDCEVDAGDVNDMEIHDIDHEMVGEAELAAMLRGPGRHGP